MMNTVQETLHAFSSTGTRRMDAELCILNLCQPELTLAVESINARLCRVEDQLKSGNITIHAPAAVPVAEEELPPPLDDLDAPPAPIEDLAKKLNTITYEILSSISRRVQRIYLQE